VNQAAGNMESEKAERPQDEQDDCNGQKHEPFLHLWFGPVTDLQRPCSNKGN
jgi:hypothetical protein